MAKKEIKTVVKLQIPGGRATPAPPVGSMLAPHGLNIAEFVQKFNDQTKDKAGSTIPVEVTIFTDRSYTFKIKTPPTSELLKKAAGIETASGEPNKKIVGKITKAQLKEIATIKMPDLNTTDIEQAMKIVAGSAKNSGIEIKG